MKPKPRFNTGFIRGPKNGEAGIKFTDQLLAPPRERALILQSKRQRRRSEANAGEA